MMDTLDWIDAIAVAVFVLDVTPEGEPVYAAYNDYALERTGLTRADIVGKTVRDLYPGRGGENAFSYHKQAIRTGQTLEYEIRIPIRGNEILVRTTLKPVIDKNGRVIRLFGTSKDVTQEERGREVQATVKTITTEMEDFITMAAHDLRTPMRNVHHIADMLREGFEDLGDGKLDLINLLEDVAIKATSLISDVLSHAQATKAKEEIVAFDFAQLCGELYDVLAPIKEHAITIDEVCLLADKTAYQIVIRNLLDNAFKHGGKSELKMSISVTQASATMLEVAVRDDGKGFANPGVAFLETGKMRTDSGFGLLGIKRLVQSRGGQIWAETPDIGHGSLIRFTLPGAFASKLDITPDEYRVSVAGR